MLQQRVLSGSLLAIGVIGLTLVDGYLAQHDPPVWFLPLLKIQLGPWLCRGALFTALVLLLTWLSAREVARLSRAGGHHPLDLEARFFAAGLVVGPYFGTNAGLSSSAAEAWTLLWLALAVGWCFAVQAIRRRSQDALANIATTLFIVLYVGGLASFLVRLRLDVGGMEGAVVLLFSMFLVKINDTGAFFTGRAFGRRRLIEWLSPGKTWEGFVGGLAAAMLSALLIGSALHFSGIVRLPPGLLGYPGGLVLLGLLMALLSVAGDLCASLLKRDAAVKDSSSAIPGMGGVLDIFDSPLLAAPAAWFFWTRLVQITG